MKYLAVLLLLIAPAPNMDCSHFKTGKFISNFCIRHKCDCSLVRVNDSVQVEEISYKSHYAKSYYDVVWKSDCHYVLVYSYTIGEVGAYRKGDSIDVVIDKVLTDSSIRVKISFKDQLTYDTMTKRDQ